MTDKTATPSPAPCDWCGRSGATHTADEHPLPRDHADYDAFFDATDDELAGMAAEAIRNFGRTS